MMFNNYILTSYTGHESIAPGARYTCTLWLMAACSTGSVLCTGSCSTHRYTLLAVELAGLVVPAVVVVLAANGDARDLGVTL